jgi:hypothetical protein
MAAVEFRCPACGFRIFNRRVPRCELCGVALPPELLFSREEAAALDAEHEKSRKEREARLRRNPGRSPDLGDAGASWGGEGDGDGGGAD